VADPHLVTADGQRLLPYQSLSDLQNLIWGVPGFYASGTTVYVRLAGDANPNGVPMAVSRYNYAFYVEQDYVYFLDLTFRHYGQGSWAKAIYFNNANDNLVQGCTFAINDLGIGIKRASHRNVIQDSEFYDTIFDWPWDAFYAGIELGGGGITFYDPTTGRGNVIRRNTFHDYFDGFGVCPSWTAGVTNETDVYENLVYRAGDDGMETDGQCSNVRIWSNTFHDVLMGISLAPTYTGPTYAIRNLIYRTGVGNNDYTGSPFKFNSGYGQSGPMYLFHNTADAALPGNNGLYIKAPGTWDLIYARNNVWAGTDYAIDNYNTSQPVDLDYNDLWTDSGGDLIRWDSTSYATLADFTAATGLEPHGLSVAPGFADPGNSDYTLNSGSDLIDAGVVIPGINDQGPHTYQGLAPNIGAFEAPTCTLEGDVDGDGDVDIADIMLVASIWHTAVGDPDYDPDYDLDGNDRIDIVDIMLVAVHWGETCPPEDGAQVWAVGNTRKVLPTDPVEKVNHVWSGATRSVGIKAARNEHEPFQLIIAAEDDPLSGVNVTASDLIGPSGSIGQDNITLYRQTYFEVTQPSDPWGTGLPAAIISPGRIPDALIPFDDPYDAGHSVGTPFDVSAGENQPIWVDIFVPADATPGEYSGILTITADGGTTTLDRITLNLTVWDFALPQTTTLDANFPVDTFWTLPPQYEIDEGDTAALHALTDKHYETLLAHRLHPFELYRRPAYSESDGTVQLDFSASDPQYEYFLDTRAMISFNLPGVYDEHDERYVIRDAAGQHYTAAAFDDPVFTDKVAQYYQLLRDHYTAQGWFDRHFVFFTDETEWVSDEPMHNGPDGLQRLLAWANLVKGVDSDFKIAAASVYPIPPGPPDRGWVDLVGYVDEWEIAPDEVEQDPETYRQRMALGERLGLYFNDYGDFIDYKATLHRALGSLAYKYDATVLVGWAVAAWVGDANSMDIINPWLSTPDPVFGNGAGALFWPGHKIEGDPAADVDVPLPSIRLELAREAAEDYEYLTMLAAQTSEAGSAELAEAFARSLAVNLLPQPLRNVDPDPEDFYTQRDLMGKILSGQRAVNLATIQGTVAESGNDAPLAGVLVSNGQGAALTDGDGTYTLAVEAGDQTLTASRDRYLSAQHVVTVGAGATLTVDFTLERVAEESTLLFSFETAGEVSDWEFENTISQERTSQHVTEGARSLKVVFDDSDWATMGTWQFPTDWSSFTALEFDVYNESDYYTYFYVGVGDNSGGWYPATGGDILLLPNASKHVVVPIADMGRDVDVSNVDWLEFEPETLAEEENYLGQTKTYPLGPRTLYFDNICLVRVIGGP
jgi:hypothetical protein